MRASPLLKAAYTAIDARIGVKRIVLALSLALLGFAVYVLVDKLRNIAWPKVFEAIAQIGPGTLALAGLFTVAAYATITVYDYFATRAIGRGDIPYKDCAIAGASSYTIAHNLGATVFTSAVVRYLVYQRHNVTPIEIVKICFIAGLTFWLGNGLVLALGFMLEPEVVTPILSHVGLGGTTVRIAGALMFAALIGWLIFVAVPRRIGKGAWAINLPSGRTTALQMAIGLVDLMCCASVLFVLLSAMPGAPAAPFTAVAVIFATAMLIGFATHAPGAAGAFEASLLIALPPLGYTAEAVVAAFILFRLYYFAGPFLIAIVVVGAREFMGGHSPLAHLKEGVSAIRAAEADQKASKTSGAATPAE